MAKWIIDPDHSVAAFSVRHMMIAQVRGQFNRIGGVISFDPHNISNSSIELTIDASSVYTGITKRDDHLKSPDFFDIANYPTILFVSNRIHAMSGNKASVTGNLTLHGVTHQVTVPVEFSGPVNDPFEEGLSVGFAVSTTINREDYGMTWNLPMTDNGVVVGKDIRLFVDMEADLAHE